MACNSLHVDGADDVARRTLDVHDHLTAITAADTARRHALERSTQAHHLLMMTSSDTRMLRHKTLT